MLSSITPITYPLIPFAYYAAASLVFYISLNVPPRTRLLCLPLLLLPAWHSMNTASYLTKPEGFSGLWALSIAMWIPHAISVLFIDHTALTTPTENYKPQIWSPLTAYKLLYSGRLIGTPREAPGIDYTRVPKTKIGFMTSRLAKLAIYWFLRNYLEPRIYPHIFLPFTAADFSPTHQTYFRRLFFSDPAITKRETLLRLALPIRWIWLSIYSVDASHTFLSLIFVIVLRIDAKEEWPPLFGSPLQASSLRGFWGGFWHRMAYRSYTNYGSLLSRRVLGCTPRSVADKVVVVFIVYAVSGAVHSVVAWCEGDQTFILESLFYLASFAAGLVETVILSAIGNLLERTKTGKKIQELEQWRVVIGIKKLLGFLWVFAFFFWLVPKWQYPKGYSELRKVEALAGILKMMRRKAEHVA